MVDHFQGDLIWIDMNPQLGHEQQGRRPALVVSNNSYIKRSNLLHVCPITSTVRKYPTRVGLKQTQKVAGDILVDQVRAVDPVERNVQFIEKADNDTLFEVLDILKGLFEASLE